MNQKKIHPSEAELNDSVKSVQDKWRDALNCKEEDRTGWQTTKELCVILGLKFTATKEKIYKGVQEGKLERKLFKVRYSNSTQLVPHYRIIEEDEITRPY
jgi:hypothetical protein